VKDVYLELLTMSGNQQSSQVTDLSKCKADGLGIQRFMLKYNDALLSLERIENSLIYRRINKLKNLGRNNQVTFEDFYRLFIDHAKSLLYVPGTPTVPSSWNCRESSALKFKQEKLEKFEQTKSF